MQKRYGEEAKFILNGDKSVEAVQVWARSLFENEEVKSFKISKDALEWFLSVAIDAYGKAKHENERLMILGKIIHTREVVKAGFDIALTVKEIKWNEFQVGTVCLLHDVARFEQALLGSYSDKKSDFDHGFEGAKMIEAHKFDDFEGLDIDKEKVVEAVKHHNRYLYVGNDNYAKITRDADKLANLRALPEMIEAGLEKFTEKGVSESALEEYRNKKMVSYVDINSMEDLILVLLSWEFDFNFSSTRKFFVDEGTREWMVKELARMGVVV